MLNDKKELLIKIFNTLSSISTKGEDTLAMADCLRALAQLVNELNKEQRENE